MKSHLRTENCKTISGVLKPVVDLNKCEGKGPCIEVCPYQVFEMKPISDEKHAQLNFIGKLKTVFHGREKAFVIYPEQCRSCGLCVTACPEKAIQLQKFRP